MWRKNFPTFEKKPGFFSGAGGGVAAGVSGAGGLGAL
jgi:hypothetical protein